MKALLHSAQVNPQSQDKSKEKNHFKHLYSTTKLCIMEDDKGLFALNDLKINGGVFKMLL